MVMVDDFLEMAANIGSAAGAVHILKDTFVGPGAIVLEGRAGHRDACECCLIDPAGSASDPKNRMCTTKGAIGTLSNQEERELCDPAKTRISRDGRCQRARDIRSAAQSCRQEFPDDNRKFFECFAPAFSRTTSRNPGNPGGVTWDDLESPPGDVVLVADENIADTFSGLLDTVEEQGGDVTVDLHLMTPFITRRGRTLTFTNFRRT